MILKGLPLSIAALVSVQKPHTDNIFSLKKGIEWRTKPLPIGKHYCYETKKQGGAGKVIGDFMIWKVQKFDTIESIPKMYIALGCVSKEFLEQYSAGKPLYANFLYLANRYDRPKELNEFAYASPKHIDCFGNVNKRIERPPQSWCFVARR